VKGNGGIGGREGSTTLQHVNARQTADVAAEQEQVTSEQVILY